jgi:hypothetical protein
MSRSALTVARRVLFRPLQGTAAYGHVVAISGAGSRLRFARGCTFTVGMRGALQITDESIGESVDIPVTVVLREEAADGREYAFRHDVDRRFVERLPEGLQRLLEQRRSKRYRLATQVRVLVLAPDEGARAEGTLVDASRDAAGVLLAGEAEERLAPWDRVGLAFKLGDGETFHFQCEIRRRKLTPHGIFYGLEFSSRTEGFAELRARFETILEATSH